MNKQLDPPFASRMLPVKGIQNRGVVAFVGLSQWHIVAFLGEKGVVDVI
jgi:hypothetical protein